MSTSVLNDVQLWLLRKPSGVQGFGDLLRIRVMPAKAFLNKPPALSPTIPSRSARPLLIHRIKDDALLFLTVLSANGIKKAVKFTDHGAEFSIFALNGDMKPSLTPDASLNTIDAINVAIVTMEGILKNDPRTEFFLPGYILDMTTPTQTQSYANILSLRFT